MNEGSLVDHGLVVWSRASPDKELGQHKLRFERGSTPPLGHRPESPHLWNCRVLYQVPQFSDTSVDISWVLPSRQQSQC
jgi:hypothetical protein